jgi:hypothetical protein
VGRFVSAGAEVRSEVARFAHRTGERLEIVAYHQLRHLGHALAELFDPALERRLVPP